jgi:hypothetical protein
MSVTKTTTIDKNDITKQNIKKETPKYERKGNLVVIKLTPKNIGKSLESPESKEKNAISNSGQVHESKKQFKCGICNANFTQKPSLNQHIKNFHQNLKLGLEGKMLIKCKECDLSFDSNFRLNRHFRSVHVVNKLSVDTGNTLWAFKCNKCELGFKSKWNLNGHIQLVHEGKKPNVNKNHALSKGQLISR